jgi:hypothetical protein
MSWCKGCEELHRKARVETEAKFYSLSKGGQGPVLRRISPE